MYMVHGSKEKIPDAFEHNKTPEVGKMGVLTRTFYSSPGAGAPTRRYARIGAVVCVLLRVMDDGRGTT